MGRLLSDQLQLNLPRHLNLCIYNIDLQRILWDCVACCNFCLATFLASFESILCTYHLSLHSNLVWIWLNQFTKRLYCQVVSFISCYPFAVAKPSNHTLSFLDFPRHFALTKGDFLCIPTVSLGTLL